MKQKIRDWLKRAFDAPTTWFTLGLISGHLLAKGYAFYVGIAVWVIAFGWLASIFGAGEERTPMPEKSTKVQAYRVDYLCDECGETVMRFTGTCYPIHPKRYEHTCGMCNANVKLDRVYPYIEHREE